MPPLSNKRRRQFGAGGIGLSLLALLALAARTGRDGMQTREQASIDQFRRNPTASTIGGLLPTFTTIKVDFPSRLALHSSALIELTYARYIADGGDQFVMQNGEMKLIPGTPRPGKPIISLARAVRVPLQSSALTIAPEAAIAPEDAGLPYVFRWTVSPKEVGENHHALLDLADLISPSTEGGIFGTTEISLAGQQTELKGGTQLVLPFKVVDDRTVGDRVLQMLAGAPALLGFILTYPLVVDWLKKRLRRPRASRTAEGDSPKAARK